MIKKPTSRYLACVAAALVAVGCASGPPELSYPAFIQTSELPDIFMASLPGIRAKQFAGDPQMRTSGNRIDLPMDWSGTSGASPGKALEIFVLKGELQLADVLLGSGGYAYLPPGTLGFNMTTSVGARILYFLENVDTNAVIKTPLILDSRLVDWQSTDSDGLNTKTLRADPGSGARTWLLRIEPGAVLPWTSSSTMREGYLVMGHYQHSECVAGEAHTAEYLTGGYFRRPSGAVNGGPEAIALTESIWILREQKKSVATVADSCEATGAQ